MLSKKYIRLSISLYAISILIIKKSNEDLKVYINYRALNALIISNRNVLLLIKEILVKLCAARIYSKFNIIAIFNEIRIRRDYKYKIAFPTRYELFEYIIILFKLCNAPVIFQVFINEILRKYLNIFYIVYLDNILVYSNIEKEYIRYINKILVKLQKIDLYLNINKYNFYIIRVKYLEFIIITNKVEINSKKINAIT